MRLASPPRFINSPASMKKGTAIKGKLSAPLMMFCATICESNMLSECINATPQTISAKAIGMPSAIAPNREKVKTASVTRGLVADDQKCSFAFLHRYQVLLARLTSQHAHEVEQKDHRRRDAEDEPGRIEKQPNRYAGGRRA